MYWYWNTFRPITHLSINLDGLVIHYQCFMFNFQTYSWTKYMNCIWEVYPLKALDGNRFRENCPLYCIPMGFYLLVCVYVVLNRFKIESFHQLENLSTMNPSTSRRDFKAGSHCKWILFLKKRKGKYRFFYIISLYHHKNITVSPSRRRCSVTNIHGTAKFSQLRFSMTG